MIQEPILRAALCYPAERSLTSRVRLFSIKLLSIAHKNGCLFLMFDLNKKIKVHSVSGIYGDHLEPQCQKWCILPLR